ncbi:hypothetical protein [Streptomyces heilongjiangensis]|uniref:Tetratricopeptide repeat protein n=1 Tax=Streptomyces heilongjiangensis TaxID=945052 RepID=A0ABW1BEJ3_9ACTN|nr:hypothetical protein [Streptomyces heilongjiangensis]MDC2951887.1 hypothetical protein [Streptomyces heilongjiangensis]
MIETFADAVACAEEALRDPGGMGFAHVPTLVAFTESLTAADERLHHSYDAVRLGRLLLELGLRNEAQFLFRLLAVFREQPWSATPGATVPARWLNSLAALGVSLGLLEETHAVLSAAHAAVRGTLGEMAGTMATRSAVAMGRGDHESAREYLAAAHRLLRTATPDEYPGVQELLASVELRLERGDSGEAHARVRRDALADSVEALLVWENARGPRAFLAVADLALAQIEAAVETSDGPRLENALSAMEVASQRISALLGADHPTALGVQADLAAAQIEEARTVGSSARLERAVRSLERVQGRLEARLGPAHPRSVAALTNLVTAQVDVLRATGERTEASRVAERLEERAADMDELLGESHPATRVVRASSAACRKISREDGSGGAGRGDTLLLTRVEREQAWPGGRYRSYRDAVRDMQDHADMRRGDHDVLEPFVGDVIQGGPVSFTMSVGEGQPATGLRIAQADPLSLGVRPAPLLGEADRLPPYVRRDRDAELRRRMRGVADRGGLIVVRGEPLAGKSRTAWEAVARTFPADTRVYAPAPGDDLRQPLRLRGPGRQLVWLDDLRSILEEQDGSAELLLRLVGSHVPVVGTMTDEAYVAMCSGGGAVARLLQGAVGVRLARGWTPAELERGERQSDPRLKDALMWRWTTGVADFLALGPVLWSELHGVELTHPRGRALVFAAIDVALCGVDEAVPLEALVNLADEYDQGPVGNRMESVAAALVWAREPRLGGASGLLLPGETKGTWRAAGPLVAQTARTRTTSGVPGPVWWRVLNGVGRGEIPGREAVIGRALAEFPPRADTGDVEAMYILAEIAEIFGEGEAGRWYQRAVAASRSETASPSFGRLLAGRAAEPEAIRYLEMAAAAGRSPAASELGRLLLDHARHWLRAAAKKGDAEAQEIVKKLWPEP